MFCYNLQSLLFLLPFRFSSLPTLLITNAMASKAMWEVDPETRSKVRRISLLTRISSPLSRAGASSALVGTPDEH